MFLFIMEIVTLGQKKPSNQLIKLNIKNPFVVFLLDRILL